jgi:hypothetical protein
MVVTAKRNADGRRWNGRFAADCCPALNDSKLNEPLLMRTQSPISMHVTAAETVIESHQTMPITLRTTVVGSGEAGVVTAGAIRVAERKIDLAARVGPLGGATRR